MTYEKNEVREDTRVFPTRPSRSFDFCASTAAQKCKEGLAVTNHSFLYTESYDSSLLWKPYGSGLHRGTRQLRLAHEIALGSQQQPGILYQL